MVRNSFEWYPSFAQSLGFGFAWARASTSPKHQAMAMTSGVFENWLEMAHKGKGVCCLWTFLF